MVRRVKVNPIKTNEIRLSVQIQTSNGRIKVAKLYDDNGAMIRKVYGKKDTPSVYYAHFLSVLRTIHSSVNFLSATNPVVPMSI